MVTLSYSVTVPKNWTPGSSTRDITNELEFEIRVNPCLVDSLDVISDPIGPISYQLGSKGISFGPYRFS